MIRLGFVCASPRTCNKIAPYTTTAANAYFHIVNQKLQHTYTATIALLLVMLLPHVLGAQTLPDPLSKKERRQIAHGEVRVALLSHRLTMGKDSAQAKVEAIYRWVTHHIRYDKRAFRAGKFLTSEPYLTLRRRKALCGGYAKLVEGLCEKAGVSAATILGHAKGASFRSGKRFYRGQHAWNAVQIGGKWQLLDATWGAGTEVIREQPIRKLAYKYLKIPYARRYKFVHRPLTGWFFRAPDIMVLSHLPVDPKWQLLHAAVSLKKFETGLDSGKPRMSQDFDAAIAEAQGISDPMEAWVEGKNGLQFNPRDDFDLAHAHVQLGQMALYKPAEAGGDTLLWHKGAEDMASALRLLVDWKRRLGDEHRNRLQELRRLEITAFRAISHTRGEIKFVNGDLQRLDNLRHKVDHTSEDERIAIAKSYRKMDWIGPPPEKVPAPIKMALRLKLEAKEDAILEKAVIINDSIKLKCSSLHRDMAKLYTIGDSLEQVRIKIVMAVEDNTLRMMNNAELLYRMGCDTLDAVTGLTRPLRMRRMRMTNRFWGDCRAVGARGVQVVGQFDAAYSVVRNLYLKGLEEDSVRFKLRTLQQTFYTWSQAREVQREIPWMQYDLESEHLTYSAGILATAAKGLKHQSRLLSRHLSIERKAQNQRFHSEMELANYVEQRAQSGRATLKLWIAEARKAARQLAKR